MKQIPIIRVMLAIIAIASIASVAAAAVVLTVGGDDSGFSATFSTSNAELTELDPGFVNYALKQSELQVAARAEQSKTDDLIEKLAGFIESGKLTQTEADAKLQVVHATRDKSTPPEKIAWSFEGLESLLASGKLTQEQFDEKVALLTIKKPPPDQSS